LLQKAASRAQPGSDLSLFSDFLAADDWRAWWKCHREQEPVAANERRGDARVVTSKVMVVAVVPRE
jgi:hypothetical protein